MEESADDSGIAESPARCTAIWANLLFAGEKEVHSWTIRRNGLRCGRRKIHL